MVDAWFFCIISLSYIQISPSNHIICPEQFFACHLYKTSFTLKMVPFNFPQKNHQFHTSVGPYVFFWKSYDNLFTSTFQFQLLFLMICEFLWPSIIIESWFQICLSFLNPHHPSKPPAHSKYLQLQIKFPRDQGFILSKVSSQSYPMDD